MEKKYLMPGEYHVTRNPMYLDTLLGSCVSVCLRNKVKGYAAMNHYLLARPGNGSENDIGRYGISSIEHIVKSLLAMDPNPASLEAQLFGGGAVMDSLSKTSNVGADNIAIAKEMMANYGIRVINSDVGGVKGRRISFNTETNQVVSKIIGGEENTRCALVVPAQSVPVRSGKKTVLIVDDSKTVRTLLRKAIETSDDLEVIGEAADAYEARQMVVELNPDVLTLDIIMPKMDGLAFLQRLQKYSPKPVVIVSTIAKAGSKVAKSAMEYGAAEVVDKDALELYKGMDIVCKTLIPKIKSAMRKSPKPSYV
ncbi:MAG: response regulator [Sedimentisphaerales bacterium]|nr:response regulator [Sedimentisphaerales bacterium]